MFNLYKGTPKDKLKALKIAEELADKSTLPILRRSLKDVNSDIVELAALLIKNLSKKLVNRNTLNFPYSVNRPVLTFVISSN